MTATYTENVVDASEYRRPIKGADVFLLNEDGTLAVTTGANPTVTDVFGFFTFTAADGLYLRDVRVAGVSYARDSIIVGSPPQFTGNTGPADNTYTSLSALLASDKTRKKANLVGDTDMPAAPDGPFNVVDGAWVRQGASGIASDRAGTLADSLAGRLTPEQFGAIGNATNYPTGFAATDDTAALTALFASLENGDSVWLSRDYLFDGAALQDAGNYTGPVIAANNITIDGPGKLIQPRGKNSVLLAITGSNIKVGGITLQGFNASFNGAVMGTALTVSNSLVGTIRFYTIGPNTYGTPIYGVGITPGTRIIGLVGSTYTLDRPQPAAWSGQILFIDALQFNSKNDTIRVGAVGFAGQEGADCTFENTKVFGSGGTGLVTVGPRTKAVRAVVRSAHDNGYLAGSKEARDYLFDNVVAAGTGRQNGGLATASAGSTPTMDFLYGGTWLNPTFSYCGDTPLEIGIHSDGAKLIGGTLGPSVAPSILLRDTRGCRVSGPIECLPQGSPAMGWSPIAIVQQTESAAWNCRAIIEGVRYRGAHGRAFAYVQQSGVQISDCHGDTQPSSNDGSDFVADFVTLAGAVTDIGVRGCTAVGYAVAVNANFGATPIIIERLIVEDNVFERVGAVLSAFQVTFRESRILRNRVRKVRNVPYNLTSAAFVPIDTVPGLTVNDDVIRDGLTVTAADDFSPSNVTLNGVATQYGAIELAIPEIKFASVSLGTMTAVANRRVTVAFRGGAEDITVSTSNASQTSAKTGGSANMYDSTGAAGNVGWATFPASGLLVTQRRGDDTGMTGRTLQRSIS